MKWVALLLVFLALPVLMTFSQSHAAIESSSEWVTYLDGDRLERARQAVTTIETRVDVWSAEKLERTEQLQQLYVLARRETWSEQAYRQRLESAGFPPATGGAPGDALSSIRAALETLGEVLEEQPPIAGSFSSREAERWLVGVAAVLGVQVDEVHDLLGLVQSQGQNASAAAAGAFLTSIDLPEPAGFGDALVQDQLSQVAEHWWLLFLCAPDDDARAEMLFDLEAAARSVSAEVSGRAADLGGEHRATAAQVRRLTAVIGAALPAVGARTVVALSSSDSPTPEETPFGSLLAELHGANREDLVVAATVDSVTYFTIAVTERLLNALSDRQALVLGRVAGLGIGDVRMIAGRLHRVRLDLGEAAYLSAEAAARAAADRYRRSDAYQDQEALLRAHKEDGRRYLSGLEPWITGGRTREGDSYRWALLSVLSNRYAQHLLLTNPALADAQRLAGEFATGIYDGTVERLADDLAERFQRDAAIDVADSFDRGYRLVPERAGTGSDAGSEETSEDGSELELIYLAFVAEAQGDGIGDGLVAHSPGSELSAASDWAHTHGLHVSISDPDAPPLGEAVLTWFTLANNAQNEVQGFGHAIRGLSALASGIDYLVEPALRDSGGPAVQLYAPRLDVARDYLAAARRFEASPGETIAVLHGLYPEAEDIAALIGTLERSVEALRNRLAEVEAADRRLIDVASGAR